MRAVLMLVITWMTLSPEIMTSAQAAPARANRVSVSYVLPKNPAHQPIYDQLREVGFLEKLQNFLTPFRLPRALLVKVEGCNGDANAFYENDVITICYEYIEQLRKTMPAETTAAGVTPIDAIVGPLVDTGLHEFGHALFDMLQLPVLGREEDAADQVSAYIMLQLGKVEARRLIGGVAYAYKAEADGVTAPPTMTSFADVHGTPRNASTMCCALLTAPISTCSATTSSRRDICRRIGPRTAKTNTGRLPMRTEN
jgi:Putative metallopeptidase